MLDQGRHSTEYCSVIHEDKTCIDYAYDLIDDLVRARVDKRVEWDQGTWRLEYGVFEDYSDEGKGFIQVAVRSQLDAASGVVERERGRTDRQIKMLHRWVWRGSWKDMD